MGIVVLVVDQVGDQEGEGAQWGYRGLSGGTGGWGHSVGIGVRRVGQEDEWAQRVYKGLSGGTPQWSWWWNRWGTVGI